MINVCVIIVTYNGSKWIEKCIGSIEENNVKIDIVVYDNNSNDDTINVIREKFRSVRIIESKRNVGFGMAHNYVFGEIIDANFDYFFLLNQDAFIEPNLIFKLVDIHQRNRSYGIISPVHYTASGRDFDNLFFNNTLSSCRELFFDILSGRSLGDLYPVSFVNAAIWLVPVNIVKAIGGFDPLFFYTGEDNDFVNRVKFREYTIGVCPSLKAYHDREFRRPLIKVNSIIKRIYAIKLIELKNPFNKPKGFWFFLKVMMTRLGLLLLYQNRYYLYEIVAYFMLLKKYKVINKKRSLEAEEYHHYV